MARVDGYNVRISESGLIWLPRYDRKAIEHFDKYYEKAGKWQWRKRVTGPPTADFLRFAHNDQPCYIVGKGGSLVNLSTKHFAALGAPIIAINESIDYVQDLNLYPDTPVYFIQQDVQVKATPKDPTIAVLHSDVAGKYEYLNKRHIFENSDFGHGHKVMSAFVAIELAKYMGCSRVFMVSFDYAIKGTVSYPEGMTDYRNGTEAWKNLKERIEKAADYMQVDYITPVPEMECLAQDGMAPADFVPTAHPSLLTVPIRDLPIDDILLPSPDSLEVHHE